MNYFPSYGRDQMEAWLTRFNPEILEREIGFAKGLGLDALRVFLSFDAYLASATGFLENVRHFADRCLERGLRVIAVTLDACGTERPESGEQWLPLREAWERAVGCGREALGLSAAAAHGVEALAGRDLPGDVEVPYAGNPATIFWQGWRQSPGNSRLGESWRPRVRAYLESLVGTLGGHPAMLAWDVMNEPRLTNAFYLGAVDVLSFLKWACQTLAELGPSAPLTVGCIFPEEMGQYDELTEGALGLLSCHSYARGEELDRYLERAKGIAQGRGKPWLLTECGNWEFPVNPRIETDEAQDAMCADILPRLAKAGMGWLGFHLIMGYGMLPGLALLGPNGTRRPAAQRLAEWLATHDGRGATVRTPYAPGKGEAAVPAEGEA